MSEVEIIGSKGSGFLGGTEAQLITLCEENVAKGECPFSELIVRTNGVVVYRKVFVAGFWVDGKELVEYERELDEWYAQTEQVQEA